MFGKVLVANRGAIACRIFRTLRRLGIASVAVYSEADRHSLHTRLADESLPIGPPAAAQSYLDVARILEAARLSGAEAIHPGYGFLSENAEFAAACASAGVVFLGPTPEQMRAFGLKHTARSIAQANGVPLLPGTALLASSEEAVEQASRIGYPVILKGTAGGGGIGMRVCQDAEELSDSFDAVEQISRRNFGQAGVYLEKFVTQARHVEVQIFGDGKGKVVALGERDCSAQRRNQKVVEETPAPGLSDVTRAALFETAVRLGEAVSYQSAGTVEFIYDDATHDFYFLEVNTRLQVEHGITEAVTGVDLVEWMLLQGAGELVLGVPPEPKGASIEVRIYAEDPARSFQPSSGMISHVRFPADVRVDTWVESGTEISPFYDPMLAKVIAHGADREEALRRLRVALDECRIDGIETNLDYLRGVCRDPDFVAGSITTGFLGRFVHQRNAIEVLEPGTQTTVQDYPGRQGFWNVGVPPSGPMDSLAFRVANRLVGNEAHACGLEITMTGPTLRFDADATIALAGADMDAHLDDVAIPLWRAIAVRAGAVLRMASVSGAGCRAYLAVTGGFDVPEYLGSRSTFILGRFGGHAGRVLRASDVLHLNKAAMAPAGVAGYRPEYGNEWNIGVLYGPHGSPDYFTREDIETFFSSAWKVHYNSDRTGIRLIGPKPVWARKDGGEAGLHPSNIHDNAYAIGTVDFTGDMPVVLGPDGPSLGGFVCPATIVSAELWKMGQLKSGDTVRFQRLTLAQAEQMESDLERCIGSLQGPLPSLPALAQAEHAVIHQVDPVVYRASGDKYLLIEYGPNVLDLELRFRVHALETLLRSTGVPGIIDITPGIRSLQIHYDNRVLPRSELLRTIDALLVALPGLDEITVPSRIVHLPLSWDDPATQLAIQKYMQSVRPDAPWCPSNIEFIRRINGLDSIDDVHRTVFAANYLVLGLGDVYLGAPVATPTDPRHRLVTTKYNPARTWTPENAVGIGGAYMCVYGMEGPGGYQFVGRTVKMWNTHASTPWLLRFFDQIRFYPVSGEELLDLREGQVSLNIEPQDFHLNDYRRFLTSIAKEAEEFQLHQRGAFVAERERWAAQGQAEYFDTGNAPPEVAEEGQVPEGCAAVRSPITASVWSIAVEVGQQVEAGQRLLVLEAMKMEVAIAAPHAGVVEKFGCAQGAMVSAGQNLITLRKGLPS